jgi:hypothetical protein
MHKLWEVGDAVGRTVGIVVGLLVHEEAPVKLTVIFDVSKQGG